MIAVVGVLLVVAAVVIVPHVLFGGIERSLDDQEADRDRTRECRQILLEMQTTKDTK